MNMIYFFEVWCTLSVETPRALGVETPRAPLSEKSFPSSQHPASEMRCPINHAIRHLEALCLKHTSRASRSWLVISSVNDASWRVEKLQPQRRLHRANLTHPNKRKRRRQSTICPSSVCAEGSRIIIPFSDYGWLLLQLYIPPVAQISAAPKKIT